MLDRIVAYVNYYFPQIGVKQIFMTITLLRLVLFISFYASIY